MNKCIFIGNLTRDPEFTTTGSGVSMCRFSIAVRRSFRREGEPDADFFNVVTWRGLADNCHKYLSKGSKVCVIGSIQNRTYDDKEGNKRTATDVLADEVEFVGPRAGSGEGAPADRPASGNSGRSPLEQVDEQLPF